MRTDERAFIEEYFRKNEAAIAKICRAYSNDTEEFKDLMQEVLLQLWKSKDSFGHHSKLSTWVYRVALNVCLSYIRKKKIRTVELQQSHYETRDTGNDKREEEIDILYRALKILNNEERAIMLLYLEEKKYEEISQILGISGSHVGVKINRTKKKLKKIIEGYGY